MNPQIRVHRNRHLNHAASSNIPNERYTCQSACRVRLVAVNDVLVGTDEDAQDTITKEYASCQWRPIGYRRVNRPAHPKHTNGNSGRTKHTEPKSELWGQAGTALKFGLCKVSHWPSVYDWNKKRCAAKADCDTNKGETGDTLCKPICFSEYKSVTIQEGKEYDVDDRQVQRKQNNDRLIDCKEKRAI